jgi:hypothetical protein
VCFVANSLRRRATGIGHVDHHRGYHARQQVAHHEAELPTSLMLLVLNADVTEEATEDEIRRTFFGILNRSPDQRRLRRKHAHAHAVGHALAQWTGVCL